MTPEGLQVWSKIFWVLSFGTAIFGLSSFIYKHLRLFLISATGFDAEVATWQPGNHPGTQRREVIKFSHSLLPACIYIAGSFAVCISKEPLAVGFSSKAIDVPYAFTSDIPYWGLEEIHWRRHFQCLCSLLLVIVNESEWKYWQQDKFCSGKTGM